MTWTFDDTELPSALTSGLSNATDEQLKNFVRFLSGDVVSTRQLTTDERIFAAIATEANVYYAAARVVLAIAQDVLAGGIEDQKVGETRIRTKQAADLRVLAQDLRARGDTHRLPSAGGIYLADKEAAEEDTANLQPAIKRGINDHPEAGEQAGGGRDAGEDDTT